jgi:hypothetical protein
MSARAAPPRSVFRPFGPGAHAAPPRPRRARHAAAPAGRASPPPGRHASLPPPPPPRAPRGYPAGGRHGQHPIVAAAAAAAPARPATIGMLRRLIQGPRRLLQPPPFPPFLGSPSHPHHTARIVEPRAPRARAHPTPRPRGRLRAQRLAGRPAPAAGRTNATHTGSSSIPGKHGSRETRLLFQTPRTALHSGARRGAAGGPAGRRARRARGRGQS